MIVIRKVLKQQIKLLLLTTYVQVKHVLIKNSTYINKFDKYLFVNTKLTTKHILDISRDPSTTALTTNTYSGCNEIASSTTETTTSAEIIKTECSITLLNEISAKKTTTRKDLSTPISTSETTTMTVTEDLITVNENNNIFTSDQDNTISTAEESSITIIEGLITSEELTTITNFEMPTTEIITETELKTTTIADIDTTIKIKVTAETKSIAPTMADKNTTSTTEVTTATESKVTTIAYKNTTYRTETTAATESKATTIVDKNSSSTSEKTTATELKATTVPDKNTTSTTEITSTTILPKCEVTSEKYQGRLIVLAAEFLHVPKYCV